ncbi:hypothetical protein SAMN05428981_1011708 [Bacillus sp. OV194]|nr:hypothetical protein SAMN05428981_1011708 [Bacillus sp. OV194]
MPELPEMENLQDGVIPPVESKANYTGGDQP